MSDDDEIAGIHRQRAIGQGKSGEDDRQLKQKAHEKEKSDSPRRQKPWPDRLRLRRALPARIKLILNLLAAFWASPHDSGKPVKAIWQKTTTLF
jgi:hypothetical protein